MSAREQPEPKNRLYNYDAPDHDDVNAVSLGGFEDHEEETASEKKPRIPAAQNAGPVLSIYRFFHLYLNSRAFSSTAELMWGGLYALVSTVLAFILMAWMGTVVSNGGDSVSSLFRVLYMLMVVVAPIWLIVHLTPSINLVKRYQNFKKQAENQAL